jgi:hypothetical protein
MHEVGIIVFFKLMILFTIKFFFDYYIFDIKFSILPPSQKQLFSAVSGNAWESRLGLALMLSVIRMLRHALGIIFQSLLSQTRHHQRSHCDTPSSPLSIPISS